MTPRSGVRRPGRRTLSRALTAPMDVITFMVRRAHRRGQAVEPRISRFLLRPSARPRSGRQCRVALCGLLGLLVLAPPAAAAGPLPDNPPVSGAGTPPRPELPRTEPAPTRAATRAVATTPRPAPRAAATATAPATVRTIVVGPAASRASARPAAAPRPAAASRRPAAPRPRRHTTPQPVRHPTSPRHRAASASLAAPAHSPPYGLVSLAALLAVLGAGSLAVTVSQLRMGAA